MTISEAFDEVLASCEETDELKNIMDALGVALPEDEYGPDTSLMQPEIKVIAGILLVDNKSGDPSHDAKKTLKDALAKICDGKPVEGVSETAMDGEVESNLDLF